MITDTRTVRIVPGEPKLYPINRWQSFKKRHAPNWFLRLFPVKEVAYPTVKEVIDAYYEHYSKMATDVSGLTSMYDPEE